MDNIFEIEAPPPGEKFNVSKMHPDNYDVINNDDDRARLLTRDERRELKEQERALRPDYERARAYYQRGREQQRRIAARIAELKLIGAEDKHYPIAQTRIAQLEQKNERIQQRINQAKPPLVKMLKIRRRWLEHKTAQQNEKLYSRLRNEMANEAETFAGLLIRTWDRLGYCFRTTHKNRARKYSVRFERCVVTPDEIQLKIKTSSINLFGNPVGHLPQGVAVRDLISDQTLLELTVACERNVKTANPNPYSNTPSRKWLLNGAWIYIERLGLVDGLFNFVPLPVVMARYPNKQRIKFPLPLGVREGRKINWVCLTDHPHLMVNGFTGGGKSNLMHVVLTTLIQMHSPDEILLVLIDLKEGTEFHQYEECPHVVGPVIAQPKDAKAMLVKLELLRQQRMNQIRERGVFKIEEYNSKVGADERMPHILIVIDEYISVGSEGRAVSAAINDAATQIATKARAAGIHLFIGVQTPYANTVPSQVKANITIVFGGRQRTQGASMSVFGSGVATKIENIKGRMVVDEGPDQYMVQIPYVSPENIRDAIERSKLYPAARQLELPEGSEIAAQSNPHDLIIATALDELGGELKAHNLWKILQDRGISQLRARELVKEIAAQKIVEYEGHSYEIVQGSGNFLRLAELSLNGNVPIPTS